MAKYKSYSREEIYNFDVVGSYFVDLYFNQVYFIANTFEKYSENIHNYVFNVKTNTDFYNSELNNIYEYFAKKTSNVPTYKRFVDLILQQLVPEDIFINLDSYRKEVILKDTVYQVASNLAVFTTSTEMLTQVIEFHKENFRETVRSMQDNCITTFITKKTQYYNDFLKDESEVEELVPKFQFDKLRVAFKELLKQKTDSDDMVKKMRRENIKLRSVLKDLAVKHKKLLSKNQSVQSILNTKPDLPKQARTYIPELPSWIESTTHTELSDNDEDDSDNNVIDDLIS